MGITRRTGGRWRRTRCGSRVFDPVTTVVTSPRLLDRPGFGIGSCAPRALSLFLRGFGRTAVSTLVSVPAAAPLAWELPLLEPWLGKVRERSRPAVAGRLLPSRFGWHSRSRIGRISTGRNPFPCTDESDNSIRVRRHTLRLGIDTGLAQQRGNILALFGKRQCHHIARAARARRTPGAVQVGLVFGGWIDVHHQFDIVDVNTACGDVGGDQNPGSAATEGAQVAIPGRLGEVAMKRGGRDARVGELFGQSGRMVFGTHEQDATAVTSGQYPDQFPFCFGSGDLEHLMGHDGNGRVGLTDRMRHRVVQKTLDQRVYSIVQSRREKEPLPSVGCRSENPGDGNEKSQISHMVGLVEHGNPDRIQRNDPLPHQVLQSPWAGDQNIGARTDGPYLPVHRSPTERSGHPQPTHLGQWGEGGRNLGRQLAGRCEDQPRGFAWRTSNSSE